MFEYLPTALRLLISWVSSLDAVQNCEVFEQEYAAGVTNEGVNMVLVELVQEQRELSGFALKQSILCITLNGRI